MDAQNDDAGADRILLIDLDNCPHELLSLVRTADRYQRVIACHGGREPRVPLKLVPVLGELINSGRVEVVPMPSGKNAADFGLTFWAGRLSAQAEENCEFLIASGDKDLDHAVKSLMDIGYKATRVTDSGRSLAAEALYETADPALRVTLRRLCQLLINVHKTFPRRKSSLLNYVDSCSRKLDLRPALQYLEVAGVVSYGLQGAVACNHGRLREILNACRDTPRSMSESAVLPESQLHSASVSGQSPSPDTDSAKTLEDDRIDRQLCFPFEEPEEV